MKKTYLLKQASQILARMPIVELARRNDLFFPLVPFSPKRATINVTDNCNLRCRMCNCWKQRSINELTLDEMNSVLTQLRELGIVGVTLTGGEPLLRKDILDIVKRCSALRFEEVTLLTNGLLLTSERAEELLQAGATTVGISLDGTEEIHDEIRGVRGAFWKATSALKLLSDLKQKKYPFLTILADLVLMKPNLTEVVPVVNLARELGVNFGLGLVDKHSDTDDGFVRDGVFCVPEIDMNGLWVEDQKELDKVIDELHQLKAEYPGAFHATTTHASLEYAREYFAKPKKSIPCLLGHTVISIGGQGQVYACSGFAPVGNIRERGLKEIIDSKEYRSKLYDIFYKRCSGCTCGYGMNYLHCIPGLRDELWWRTRLLLK